LLCEVISVNGLPCSNIFQNHANRSPGMTKGNFFLFLSMVLCARTRIYSLRFLQRCPLSDQLIAHCHSFGQATSAHVTHADKSIQARLLRSVDMLHSHATRHSFAQTLLTQYSNAGRDSARPRLLSRLIARMTCSCCRHKPSA
jgi:hypothetical protein